MRIFWKVGTLFIAGLIAVPAVAQQSEQAGRVAESAVGVAGQRQVQKKAPADTQPMGRLDTRLANRVQNRVRNRVDRHYDPRANTTLPFEDAAADSVTTGNSVPR